MNKPLTDILDRLGLTVADLAKYGMLAAAVLLIVFVAWKVLTRRKREAPPPRPDVSIDVASLGSEGPPALPPFLEHYHVPVRLAAVVLAPTGRVRGLPPPGELPDLLDHVVPGLAQVLAAHHPLIRPWAAQLSAEGFAHAVFAHVKLPGDGGKGTPWCSVAGRFKVQRESFMAGLILRAAGPNNFGQTVIEEGHEWLGILRVKSEG